ncbi:hypothetical protein [Roseobacter sp. OBYS 0001]|uniref:VpaChn25_0724 family phage protein n=1 Tax=Roseobacter sp. OBYS 0001 TaxID=882651 RepID=UPI001BC59C5E|nr:hypothetical protein [Roseobacter sp. OBYS 0001]GIT85422.1 hypothetical protein ROBYS_04380 [Roseobacter sp. OBYS 0001]
MNSWRDNVAQVEIEKRRWAVLRHLEDSKPARSLNADILLMGCRAAGLPTTEDQMKETWAWLEERRFVERTNLGPMEVVTITSAGREVIQGHKVVEGLIPFGLDI